jgi:hypothetical protein
MGGLEGNFGFNVNPKSIPKIVDTITGTAPKRINQTY